MAGVVSDIITPQLLALSIGEQATGILTSVQSAVAMIQSSFMTAAYAAAIPIVAIEFRGLVDVIMGIGETFWGVLESLGIIVPDTFDGIMTFGTFILTNTICLARGIGSLPECIFFYIVDIIIQLLYLPVRVILWFVYTFIKIDLYAIQNRLWKLVVNFNDFMYGIIGFDLIYWPPYVRNKCYNCKRLKLSVVNDKANKLGDDFMNKVAPKLWPGLEHIMQGANELMNPFG